MTALPVSVVIVSHERPKELCLALTAVRQLDYANFEIVVVADAAGVNAVQAHQFANQIKIVSFDALNISAARNAGVAAAAGVVIAFIDDDAVPEPSWLTHLTAPLIDPTVSATGGYVLGRNGISFQWKARTVGRDAQTKALLLDSDAPEVFIGSPQRAIKTEGTNMAVRRDVIVALGGFDEAFQFYLDETDLNMRLGQMRHKTVIVPLARVHHKYAESTRRRLDRVPTDLTQIGASLAVFLRKYGGSLDILDIERNTQRRRLLIHMVAGRLLPSDVTALLIGFDCGCAAGKLRKFGYAVAETTPPSFLKFTQTMGQLRFVVGRAWRKKALFAKAVCLVGAGDRVVVIILSPTAFCHRVQFVEAGYWLWTGGQFGKICKSEKFFQIVSLPSRVKIILNILYPENTYLSHDN